MELKEQISRAALKSSAFHQAYSKSLTDDLAPIPSQDLATYLENAEYVDDSALTHPRTDNIEHFYYFKVQVNGRWVRLNVAKHVNRRNNGHVIVKYFLYSINDIVE